MAEEFKAFGGNGGLDFFRSFADATIRNQKHNPGDFIGPDGLLYCGTCKEPRQSFYQFKAKMDDGTEQIHPVKVTNSCRCERERQEEEKRKAEYEAKMSRIAKLKKQSLMEAKFVGVTFDTLQVTKYNERNLKLCRSYANRFDEMLKKTQGLLFWGSVGTGKSFAAAAIANQLLNSGIAVVMTSMVKIIEQIQSREIDEETLLRNLAYADLVIFDDLGAERKTDYGQEIVYNLIDDRYRRKLPMIITTNNTFDEMYNETDQKFSRTYDRIFEVCHPMQFSGPSWRRKIARENFDALNELFGDDE